VRRLPGYKPSRYHSLIKDSVQPSGWLDEFGPPNSNGAFDSANLPVARFYYRRGDEPAIWRTVVAVEPGCDGCVGRRERCLWTPYRFNCIRATLARTKSLRTVDGHLVNMRTGETEGAASTVPSGVAGDAMLPSGLVDAHLELGQLDVCVGQLSLLVEQFDRNAQDAAKTDSEVRSVAKFLGASLIESLSGLSGRVSGLQGILSAYLNDLPTPSGSASTSPSKGNRKNRSPNTSVSARRGLGGLQSPFTSTVGLSGFGGPSSPLPSPVTQGQTSVSAPARVEASSSRMDLDVDDDLDELLEYVPPPTSRRTEKAPAKPVPVDTYIVTDPESHPAVNVYGYRTPNWQLDRGTIVSLQKEFLQALETLITRDDGSLDRDKRPPEGDIVQLMQEHYAAADRLPDIAERKVQYLIDSSFISAFTLRVPVHNFVGLGYGRVPKSRIPPHHEVSVGAASVWRDPRPGSDSETDDRVDVGRRSKSLAPEAPASVERVASASSLTPALARASLTPTDGLGLATGPPVAATGTRVAPDPATSSVPTVPTVDEAHSSSDAEVSSSGVRHWPGTGNEGDPIQFIESDSDSDSEVPAQSVSSTSPEPLIKVEPEE
jgi:hypothetical protein